MRQLKQNSFQKCCELYCTTDASAERRCLFIILISLKRSLIHRSNYFEISWLLPRSERIVKEKCMKWTY